MLAAQVILKAKEAKKTIVTAESCTGGLIGAALTNVSGSSSVFHGGFITYANEAKINMLGVDPMNIETKGAVSHIVAKAMAMGALRNTDADIAIAVTGIAGPTGGTAEKPVGTVYFGLAYMDQILLTKVEHEVFENISRDFIRTQTVEKALSMVLEII